MRSFICEVQRLLLRSRSLISLRHGNDNVISAASNDIVLSFFIRAVHIGDGRSRNGPRDSARPVSHIFTVQFRDITLGRMRKLLFTQRYYPGRWIWRATLPRITSNRRDRFPRKDSLILRPDREHSSVDPFFSFPFL